MCVELLVEAAISVKIVVSDTKDEAEIKQAVQDKVDQTGAVVEYIVGWEPY